MAHLELLYVDSVVFILRSVGWTMHQCINLILSWLCTPNTCTYNIHMYAHAHRHTHTQTHTPTQPHNNSWDGPTMKTTRISSQLFGKLAEIQWMHNEATRQMADKHTAIRKAFNYIFQEGEGFRGSQKRPPEQSQQDTEAPETGQWSRTICYKKISGSVICNCVHVYTDGECKEKRRCWQMPNIGDRPDHCECKPYILLL